MPQATPANYSVVGASERVNRTVNFAPGLATGEILVGIPTVAISVISGVDSAPQTRLTAGPVIVGATVTFQLGGMQDGATYQIVVTAQTSAGEILDCVVLQACAGP